jgi:DNA-binding transcriptional ArsR family regulator
VSGSSGSRGSKGKGAARGSGKGKPKQKRPSSRGMTSAARERAARSIPTPNFALVAGDPLKAQIVAVALHRLYSPSEFAREAGVKLNVASYHFKVLREKGILELVKEDKVRGSTVKHLYRATQAAIVNDADWGDLAKALAPIFAGTILQDFSVRVTQAIETGHLHSRDDFALYWTPADLDEIAWKEQVELDNWFIEESKRLVVDTANRRANGESDGGFHATVSIAVFPSPTHSELMKHRAKENQGKGRRKAKAKGKTAKSKRTAKPKGTRRGKGGKG